MLLLAIDMSDIVTEVWEKKKGREKVFPWT
jgi:predicted CDP-diglyceride synthetase/phosphatidate cytidylyltransferase